MKSLFCLFVVVLIPLGAFGDLRFSSIGRKLEAHEIHISALLVNAKDKHCRLALIPIGTFKWNTPARARVSNQDLGILVKSWQRRYHPATVRVSLLFEVFGPSGDLLGTSLMNPVLGKSRVDLLTSEGKFQASLDSGTLSGVWARSNAAGACHIIAK